RGRRRHRSGSAGLVGREALEDARRHRHLLRAGRLRPHRRRADPLRPHRRDRRIRRRRRGMKRLLALTLLALPAACITGPDEEPKSSLEYLNGERYRGDNTVGGIPLTIERRPQATTISGK